MNYKNWLLVLGPPGTGKTTTLLRHLDAELREVTYEEIAFVTFTRDARSDARRRAADQIMVAENALTWFRTIHSTAFHLLQAKPDQMMGPKEWAEFGARYGYEISGQSYRDDEDPDVMLQTEDDRKLAANAWGRSRMLDAEETATMNPFNVDHDDYLQFHAQYNRFRDDAQRYDFHDLLEKALHLDARPPVRVAFIDEAQDLSPLQVALAEKWFEPCMRVYVGGDDDQAIMGFQGGDPHWLLSLSRRCGSVTVLDRSHRIPYSVHEVATSIITRNKQRVWKPYRPRADLGEVVIAPGIEKAISLIDEKESTFILSRNWTFLKTVAAELRDQGIAFKVERHQSWGSLGKMSEVLAVKGIRDLSMDRRISPRMFQKILDQIPTTKKDGVLPRGYKKRAKENDERIDLEALREWGLTRLVDAIREFGTGVLVKMKSERRDEIDRLLNKYHGELPTPQIICTSMHASKGREADTVIVIPNMSRASSIALMDGSQEERESEYRVAYVAVTRARRRLILVDETFGRVFPYVEIAESAKKPVETISQEAAEFILKTCERLCEEEERFVVEEWYSVVSRPMLYPELSDVGRRFDGMEADLVRQGFHQADARWAAYMYFRDVSR